MSWLSLYKASPATFDDNCGTTDVDDIYCIVAAFNWEEPGKGTYKITVDSLVYDDVNDFTDPIIVEYVTGGVELKTVDLYSNVDKAAKYLLGLVKSMKFKEDGLTP